MGTKKLIPCYETHEMKNGYSFNLQGHPSEGIVRVYILNKDGSTDHELAKDQYFFSDSILHLPLYLNKEETIMVKYQKEVLNLYSFWEAI